MRVTFLDKFYNPTHVISPFVFTLRNFNIERKFISFIKIRRINIPNMIISFCTRNGRTKINRTRHNKAIVVVGMFTDDIDSARCIDGQFRLFVIFLGENVLGFLDWCHVCVLYLQVLLNQLPSLLKRGIRRIISVYSEFHSAHAVFLLLVLRLNHVGFRLTFHIPP